MTRLVVAFLTAAAMVPSSQAAAQVKGSIIQYGASDKPGIEATAIHVQPRAPALGERQRTVRFHAGGLEGSKAVPAPIAISAHNCIPRTDARGISLAFEFAEGTAADCLSFVSPPPAPNREPNARRPGPRPHPEQLAHAGFDRVISLAPRPDLAIAPARIGLTGLISYFWVGNDLSPISATAGVRGLTVTAEARPVQYLWEFGDGNERQTTHAGRPWTRQRPKGNVGHVYETKGRYEPFVEVVWAARWRVNGGPWRDLGYFSTTGSADYPVREVVAVLVRRR